MTNNTPSDPAIGKMAINFKFINEKQLNEALLYLKNEKASGKDISLGEILIKNQMINPTQLKLLSITAQFWEIKQLDIKFGIIAIKKGFVSQERVNDAIKVQAEDFKGKKLCRLIGDILVEKGSITKDQRDIVLIEQNRIQKKNINEPPKEETSTNEEASAKKENEQEDKEIEFDLTLTKEIITKGILKIKKGAKFATVQDVKDFLVKEEIIHGIIEDEKIKEFLESPDAQTKTLIVAQGTPPVPGADASVNYHFDINYLKVGAIKKDGTIDFKERGEIPHVKNGDLLAEKLPIKEGVPGTDIFGVTIPIPEDPKDIKIFCGTGAELSEDGNKIFATLDGQPQIASGNKIFVFPELNIHSDIDLKTGHIEFDGNVIISGSIQDGFRVKAGNLRVKEILAAEIITSGDIIVSGGIIGANINSKGSVHAKYIQSSNIKAYGDISTSREIVDSEIYSSGAINITTGTIISSVVSAKKGIFAEEIGTQVSHPCKLKVGIDKHVQKLINENKKTKSEKKEQMDEIQKKINEVDEEINGLHKKVADFVQAQEQNIRIKNSILEKVKKFKKGEDNERIEKARILLSSIIEKAKYLDDTINSLFEKEEQDSANLTEIKSNIPAIEKEIETLDIDLDAIIEWAKKEKGNPIIKVGQSVYEGTIVYGPNSSTILRSTFKKVTIREVKTLDANSREEWEIQVFAEN